MALFKTYAILRKEYLQIVRKKTFVISTLLTPLLMGGTMILPKLIQNMGREAKTIEVWDYSGNHLGQELARQINTVSRMAEGLRIHLKHVPQPSTGQQENLGKFLRNPSGADASLELEQGLRQRIESKKIEGVLFLPPNMEEQRRCVYCGRNISDFALNQMITLSLQRLISDRFLSGHKVPLEVVRQAGLPVQTEYLMVRKGQTSHSDAKTPFILSIMMSAVLMSMIMGYGTLLMQGIIEEKNQRISEVLVSSTTPRSIFWGKVCGIGAAGLTQFLIWGLLLLSLSRLPILPRSWIPSSIWQHFSWELIVSFVLFSILGYLMFSVFFAAIGALVSTEQEAQQWVGPLMLILFLPFLFILMVAQNPDARAIVWLSQFPLFSPMLMFARIAVAMPPLWQIFLSISTTLLFTAWVIHLGARIFRVGLLLYGKRPTIREIWRWLRHP